MAINFDNATITSTSAVARDDKQVTDIKRVAAQFEALLLAQLTAKLNPSSDDEDADLFKSDATDTFRQLFSEQLAQTMADSGGIGLADLIANQMNASNGKISQAVNHKTNNFERAINAARSVRHAGSGTYTEAVIISEAANDATLSSETATPSTATTSSLSNLNATRARRVTTNAVPDAINHVAASPATLSSATSSRSSVPVALQMPVAGGRITSHFGARHDPFNNNHKHHHGIDIAAPRGTPIEAAASGRVAFAGRRGGYGNVVIIEHADGRQTRYAHADKLLVRAGDIVRGNQVIATVGSTGRSTGNHLHFEVRQQDGRTLNPIREIAKDATQIKVPTLARR